jgi:uncharacterized Tic20 family protein
METSNEKSTGALLHLSVFTQYFFPLGNFIFPAIIWGARKKNSDFVDHHGKQALNFQLSILLYSLILAIIAIPIFIYTLLKNIPTRAFINDDNFQIENFNVENITGMVILGIMAVFLFGILKMAEFFLVIYATIKAANGERYKYPLTINFIKTTSQYESQKNAEPELQTE